MVKILNVCKWTGEIKDYELIFRGSHRNRAVATIEPKEGSTVPVTVWNISRYDEVGLDYYEGFPVLYNKLDFQVEMTDGSVITAMAYVMNPGRDFGKPSERDTSPLYPKAITTLELALRGFSPLSNAA